MADLRRLKHDAIEAVDKGNWKKACWCYANLEKDEPADPRWPLKLGECQRKLGNHVDAVKAFSRALDAYAKSGLLLKAIAVCKLILDLDPAHTQTQQLLATLYASQRTPAEPVQLVPGRAPRAPVSVALAPPPNPFETEATLQTRRQAMAPPAPDGPSDAAPPLRRLRLSALVPGARQSEQFPAVGSSAAMEIPVDDEPAPAPAASSPPAGAGRHTMARFVLPKTPFFSVLSPALLRSAIERVRLIQLAAGETLFCKGDHGDALYVLAEGEVAVLVPQEVARLGEGEFFGEIALLVDRPRTATVRATMDSQVLAIDRPLLSDLVAASPDFLVVLLRFVRERLIATLAATSPLFTPFTALERLGLAARFRVLEIDKGFRVVEEGSRSAGLFIVLAGEAKAVSGGHVVAHLDAGDMFGEISLITGQPACLTVVTSCRSFALFLSRTDFNELIMTHPQVLEYVSSLAAARSQEVGRLDIL